jgi:YD repeat-containing protein
MNRFSILLSFVIAVVCLSAGMTALSATPPTIDSFPYQPNESAQASDFEANYGSGPTAAGSTWTNGTLTGSRCGTGGTGVQAWAVLHNANYANDTTTWLHSPFFDFSSDSGLELRFELWVKTHIGVSKADGMKLQVSTNGGSSWSDVTTQTVAYTSTVSALSTAFGGSNNGWGGTTLGGGSATTCAVDLNTWYGQSDVRFRWCFASDDDRVDNGVVIDGIRIVPVVASVGYSSGYVAVPQGSAVGATITKSGGSAFTSGMTVSFGGSGLTGTVSSVTSADVCSVTFTAARMADVAGQMFFINLSGGTRVCEGIVNVFFPQQLISNRQGSSAQEPPLNGTMGGNGVYLHNGEFCQELPILSIPGRMLPLSIGLTYRSHLDTIGPVGAGWSVSFDNRLTYSSGGDDITLYSGSGRIDTFELESGGTAGEGPYVLPGFFLELWRDDNGSGGDVTDDVFTIKYAHGSLATYEPIHEDTANQQVFRQTSFADRYGNTITYEYNGSGQLEHMLGDMYDGDLSRYALTFEYGDDGRLSKITDYADFTGQQSVIGSSYTDIRDWEFFYNSDARLTEIRLPKTERYYSDTKGSTYRTRVQFTYDSNDNLLEVIDARQANETSPYGWLKNHYTSDKVDYQDVGRTGSSDTTHRQHIVYTSSTEVSVVNAEAHRSRFTLNADGTASKVRHYTGTWESDLDPIAGEIHTGDPDYFDTDYVYDSEFHVIQVTFPRGNYTKFRYDIGSGEQRSRGNLLRVLSHRGSLSSSTVPSNQANGLLAKFTYTSAAQFNLLATSVGPRGFELASNYDITTHTNITNDWSADFTTTNTYYFSHGTYPDGTLQKVTSPDVDTTRSPDTLNNGQVLETEFTYNAFGQVLSAEDDAGVDTLYAYGSSGFGKGYLASVSVGSSSPLVTEFTYNSVGRAITVEDPNGEVWTTYINQLDQAVKGTMPEVSAQTGTGSSAIYYTETDYDLNGNVEKSRWSNIDEEGDPISPSEPETTYVYNILDLATSVTEPIDGSTTRTTSFAYDLIFRLTETTLPAGNKSGTDYDELNRAFKNYFGYDTTNVAKASALIKTEVFYDANSNVIESIDARNNDSDFTYDAYDRLIKAEDRLDSNRNYTTYAYNQAGQVVETVRKGKKNLYTPAAGMTPESYAVSNDLELAKAETRYDNLGRAYFSRTRARNSDDNANLGYSSYQGSGSTDGWSQSTVRFRSNGQVEETYGDLGYETRYEYDSYNRLARIIDDRDGGGASTSDDDNYDEYSYDSNGNVLSVTAHLYDDVGSGGNKTLTTNFTYDEINRLIEDRSPDLGGSTYLYREFKYDSRGNLVISIDRKDQMRRTSYDLLSRPIRHIVDGVESRTFDSGGQLITPLVARDIVTRTVYNKNSDVTQSIDPNGNRTYFKYDLADRWLQTQHADGGTGTPLKTTAGTTHSISAVGSTVFHSGTSTYDGNSNLLNLKDENDTTFTWTYDNNDNVLTEAGAVAGGNPFEIEGETGLSYTYDGLYRAIYGETHDASDTLTETDSVFNSLSGLERQRQRVHLAHPDDAGYSHAGAVASKFDESGRRFQRTNPGDLTRTTWEFDSKHRPTDTWLEYNSGGWSSPALISQYKYLGGGLLHSQQKKYIQQTTGTYATEIFPIVSDFEHDNLLRVTSVRHWRDDSGISSNYRLLGRYDYAYDANSMMRWEARWHEDDDEGASITPDETDFYFYDKRNELEKAVYNATKYGFGSGGIGTVIDTGNADIAAGSHFGDDTDNLGTYSDRVYYARRRMPTRESVNWYRGSASRTDDADLNPAYQDDTSVNPTQKTSYATSDDPGADPDTPASDGEGSRHNYTVIGQVGHTYDKNRNVLADGTREFRYNYKNQLRHVWRKSDGDDEATGLISKYREDAFGRRVYAESYWELSRRVYLDTRFELDIDMDADNDSGSMDYVDGGITSDDIPGPGDTDQRALWDSFIRRDYSVDGESWYFDFLVDVPEGQETEHDFDEYLGYVAYDIYEVRIFAAGYELWETAGPTLVDSYAASTVGRRNIGIRAGEGAGVWVDGVEIMAGPSLTMNTPVTVGFGTHQLDSEGPGLVLLENLNYVKAWQVGPEPGPVPSGGPAVYITNFDGPRPVTVWQPIDESPTTAYLKVNYTEDGTRADMVTEEGGPETQVYLPNGRRMTTLVVSATADVVTYGEGGRDVLGPTDFLPGANMHILVDAVGTPTPAPKISMSATVVLPTNAPTPSNDFGPWNGLNFVSLLFGPSEPVTTQTAMVSAFAAGASGATDIDVSALGTVNCDNGECACRYADPSMAASSVGTNNLGTGACEDGVGVSGVDLKYGITYCPSADKVVIPVGDGVTYDPTSGEYDTDGRTRVLNGCTIDEASDILGLKGGVLPGPTNRLPGENPDVERGKRLAEAVWGTPGSGGGVANGKRIAELVGWLIVDGIGVASGIAMIAAPTGITQLIGVGVASGATMALVAHLDELYELASGNPGLLSQADRDNLVMVGTMLEAIAGGIHMIKELLPALAKSLDNLIAKVDDLAKAGKDDAAGAGKTAASTYEEAATGAAFHRLESLTPADRVSVESLADSMKCSGWVGDPIKVFERNGTLYILDGHHRYAAARAAGIKVRYQRVTEAELKGYGYDSADDVIDAAANNTKDTVWD